MITAGVGEREDFAGDSPAVIMQPFPDAGAVKGAQPHARDRRQREALMTGPGSSTVTPLSPAVSKALGSKSVTVNQRDLLRPHRLTVWIGASSGWKTSTALPVPSVGSGGCHPMRWPVT